MSERPYTPAAIYVEGELDKATVAQELESIADGISGSLPAIVPFLAAAPGKPRTGMIAGADGTNWNPGAGQGLYIYYGAAWNKLG